jgi:hypothetical protein
MREEIERKNKEKTLSKIIEDKNNGSYLIKYSKS